MATRILLFLAELSFRLGLIGVDEYVERCDVAWWLGDEGAGIPDPREPVGSDDRREKRQRPSHDAPGEPGRPEGRSRHDEPDWLKFVFRNQWVFTRSDPDPYPSTPHGHLHDANRKWPKLNPYTGRVFKAKHQEDASMRLGKTEMRDLWTDEAFRAFCRSYILWYTEEFEHHRFSVAHPLHFPRW
jgi:hypothetical protein